MADKPEKPEHRLFFHWLPWVLPMLAIALPEIILIVIGSARLTHPTLDLAAASIDHGDLLIPVIIICAEAFRRWWETSFTNPFVSGVAAFLAFLSAGSAIIALIAAALVLANPHTRGWAEVADTFTWVPLALGLAAGTIAMWQTVPPKAGP